MRRLQLHLAAIALLTLAAACGGGGGDTPANPPVTVGEGACCGDPNSCGGNICDPSLHCGNSQNPIPAYRCCAIGKFCCSTEADCQPNGISPGYACDTAHAACFTTCTSDSQCAAAFHCDGSTCVADLALAASGCDEPSDCASGNCSADFDPSVAASTFCAPAATCADEARTYDIGYTLCSGNAFERRCEAAGTWSPRVNNPNPSSHACDFNGAGAATGFWDAATCTSGFDAIDPGFASTCVSCAPYHGTAAGCLTDGGCANNDANCWTGYHCAANVGNKCVSNALGSACDIDAECTSGRCDPEPQPAGTTICQAKLPDLSACNEDSDCATGRCDTAGGSVCRTKLATGTACTKDSDCIDNNCSEDYDSGILYCAGPGTCADNASAYSVNYALCTGTTSSRLCSAEGDWANRLSFVAATCSGGTGYLVPSCTSGQNASGFTTSCQTCGAFMPNPARDGCLPNCGGADVNCSDPAKYCNGTVCVWDLGLGATCSRNTMCSSGYCNGTCQDSKLPDGSPCTSNSDCQNGYCWNGLGVSGWFTDYLCHSTPEPSCPYVFVWDGTEFRFETDVQGHIIGNSQFSSRVSLYAPQYVVLPTLQPDLLGDFRVKIREPLPEIDYVDEVKLLVVDFPEGHEILSSSAENTYALGYVAPPGLFTARDPIPPITATDSFGADIRPHVLAVDGVIAPARGVEEPTYTFDFGYIANPDDAKLLIDGWALIGPEYATSTAQSSYLEVVDAGGAWVAARTFGFTAGDLKPMAIPLAGLFRSNDHRIRVHLGRGAKLRSVIDRARLDTSAPVPVQLVAELSPATADLRERGFFSNVIASYDHRLVAIDDALTPIPSSFGYGPFTRLGEVGPLLAAMDDTYVVMRHGDELEMAFAGGLPPPAEGMRRAYVAKISLFYKSLKISDRVDPLPFHGMSGYPYPETESFPSDPEHELYRAVFNTRVYVP